MINIARSALFAQRAALEVTGHNVANVETPGYV
ncbi:MAG: flagellar basal body protein, partial [Armatimonadota bacterium]